MCFVPKLNKILNCNFRSQRGLFSPSTYTLSEGRRVKFREGTAIMLKIFDLIDIRDFYTTKSPSVDRRFGSETITLFKIYHFIHDFEGVFLRKFFKRPPHLYTHLLPSLKNFQLFNYRTVNDHLHLGLLLLIYPRIFTLE
jgi:hypothetical protein